MNAHACIVNCLIAINNTPVNRVYISYPFCLCLVRKWLAISPPFLKWWFGYFESIILKYCTRRRGRSGGIGLGTHHLATSNHTSDRHVIAHHICKREEEEEISKEIISKKRNKTQTHTPSHSRPHTRTHPPSHVHMPSHHAHTSAHTCTNICSTREEQELSKEIS